MDYIDQLKSGCKLHIKFPTVQKDYYENCWTEEVWSYEDKRFIITYIGHKFTSNFDEDNAKGILKDYKKENPVIEIIDKDGMLINKEEDKEYQLYLKLKEKYE